MTFGDELNNFMKILNCNSKDLCETTEISPTVISRYLNNKRTPKIDSKNFEKIVDGLYILSIKNSKEIAKESIQATLEKSINPNNILYDILIDNFNTLQAKLNISTVDIAKAINFDASFLSRIKNRQRKPSNIENFIKLLVNYFVLKYNSDVKKHVFASLFNCSIKSLDNIEFSKKELEKWLTTEHQNSKMNIEIFLSRLDNFNLNDYIRTDLSKIKVPTTPIIIKSSKTFYGAEGRKKAEGEFLKITLLSKSKEPIFFYSDLPIAKAGEDESFKNKWIVAMTMLLKKGLHLNIIHNINRPINEMLLGLESWIPIYMTGSISPYYYEEPPSSFFHGSQCTSGSIALSGECIEFDENKSRFYLTTKKEELIYEKKKSAYMLSKAKPLMKIFKEVDDNEFKEFINRDENKNYQVVKKECFKNIDFYTNEDKWIMINKNTSPQIHFVIYNDKLKIAIKDFLNQ